MKSLFTAVLVLLVSTLAHAYYSTMDTGELVNRDAWKAMLEAQGVFNRYDGANVVGHAETGLTPESSVEGLLGFGTTDYQLGGFYKFVPFPDVEGQPALGGKAGFILAHVDHKEEASFRFHPLISKQLDTDIGKVTPYASIPFGITIRGSDTYCPVQIEAGAEWKIPDNENFRVSGELGINLNKSFSYISIGLAYLFDDTPAAKKR